MLSPARFRQAPVSHGIRYDLNGTFQPVIHPRFGLPDPLPGFTIGAVPALVGAPVAAEQVDRLVTLDVAGKLVPIRVVGTARLFPTFVERPSSFVVVDYDTLFAALNADQPGLAPPSEAWFFDPPPAAAAAKLAKPPFRAARAVRLDALTAAALGDPLAAGTRTVLTVAAAIAAALALAGLVLGTRSALVSERSLVAEYEALGVRPRTLERSAQARVAALAALGLVAAVAGAVLSVRLVAALVAVAGTARRPLPPIVAAVPWPAVAAVVAGVAVAALAAAALLTGRALRESAARRLRA